MAAKRGRVSAASLETAVINGNFGQRPEPVDGLTEAEVTIWRETVASEAAEFFATGALRGLLKDYCRHRAAADKITEVINLFEVDWIKGGEGFERYSKLLHARDSESRAAAGMATKLRLTNQARYTPQAAATASRGVTAAKRPWE